MQPYDLKIMNAIACAVHQRVNILFMAHALYGIFRDDIVL